jgi:hypothetical protein
MRRAGWLKGENGCLIFPGFDRHNGETAKARAETNRRVAKHRSCNGKTVTSSLQKPLPDKSKSKKETSSLTPLPPAGGELAGPPALPEVESTGRKFPDHAAIIARINAIRPEWAKPAHWSAAELHGLHDALTQFYELDDADWQMVGRFMATRHDPAAGYWQPRNRSKFVATFSDVFQSAQRWAGKSAPRQSPPATQAAPIPRRSVIPRSELEEFFGAARKAMDSAKASMSLP